MSIILCIDTSAQLYQSNILCTYLTVLRRRGEVFSVTATAIMTSSLKTDHFYTQTMASLVMRLIWNMSLGDMLCKKYKKIKKYLTVFICIVPPLILIYIPTQWSNTKKKKKKLFTVLSIQVTISVREGAGCRA